MWNELTCVSCKTKQCGFLYFLHCIEPAGYNGRSVIINFTGVSVTCSMIEISGSIESNWDNAE